MKRRYISTLFVLYIEWDFFYGKGGPEPHNVAFPPPPSQQNLPLLVPPATGKCRTSYSYSYTIGTNRTEARGINIHISLPHFPSEAGLDVQ